MPVEVSEKLYTVKEFLELEWPDDDENDYELIGGEIVAKSSGSTSGKHAEIAGTITHYLKAFGDVKIGQQKLGRVYAGGSTNLGQSQGSYLPKPDVCFVLNDRTPSDFDGPIPVAPDLVVEVWSPSDTTEIIHNKVEAYREAGVSLIWSVYMLSKFILVYSLNDPDIKFLDVKGELDGGEVLPGFKLKVSALFE